MPLSQSEIIRLIGIGHVPGITLAITSAGANSDIEYTTAGVADIATGVSVGRKTLFNVASLTKPFFAYIVLHLAHKGIIDLDTPITQYIQDKHHDAFKLGTAITARQILSHQTGLPNNLLQPHEAELLALSPGECLEYSGLGYLYLQQAIEDATGSSLYSLADAMFKKIGMRQSYFGRAPENKPVAVPHVRVKSEAKDGKIVTTHENGHPAPLKANAAFGLHTTAHDYALFMRHWMNNKTMQNAFAPCISAQRDAWAKRERVGNDVLEAIGWALGWGIQKTPAGRVAFHWGCTGGTKSLAAINLDTKRAIMFSTNSGNGLSVANDLVRPVVGDMAQALDYLSGKFGYALYDSSNPHWEAKQAVIMHDKHERQEFTRSLKYHAVTSGRDANCFFQSFMHTLSAQPDEVILNVSKKRPEATRALEKSFQEALQLTRPLPLLEIIAMSRKLHPLERESVFGPVLRKAYNRLVEEGHIHTPPLGYKPDDIVLANQTLSFANAFGVRLHVYMNEEEFAKARKFGMSDDVARRIQANRHAAGSKVFFEDCSSDAIPADNALFDLHLVYVVVNQNEQHLNYTLGSCVKNAAHISKVNTSRSPGQDGCYATSALDPAEAPLANPGVDTATLMRERFNLPARLDIASDLRQKLLEQTRAHIELQKAALLSSASDKSFCR